MGENKDTFIHTARSEYFKIGHVTCPVFGYEKIYFNDQGFRHLINKGQHQRTIYEQKRRVNLLPYAVSIISTSLMFVQYYSTKKVFQTQKRTMVSIAYFWSFVALKGGKVVTVVVRKLNDQPKHFYSVMDGESEIQKYP